MDSTLAWWCSTLVGCITLLFCVLWWWNEWMFLTPLKLRSKGAKLPPGHMGLPFFGEMISFLWYFKILCRPDDFIASKRKRYGDGVGMYRSHLFGGPSIIACSPASNKFILQSYHLFTIRWPSVELVGVNSLVNVTGEPHNRLRTFVLKAVNKPEALKQICLRVQSRFISCLQSWAERGRIKASDETSKVTFENICEMFISLKPGAFQDELKSYFKGVVGGIRSQPFNFPGTAFHWALKCRRKLTEVFLAELEKRKQRSDGEDGKMNDLLEGLMQMRDGEGKQMEDDEVVDNMVSLIIGGYESTAIATMWALYYLSKSPAVLRRLREENMEIRNKKQGDFITMDHISEMKYTAKVVEETIRLANIAPLIFRQANEDVDYQGYRIPKGWKVVIWLRHLHTDPANFDDPLTFNPDRWNESPKPGTYQVFGVGPRICAGNMLARMQLAIFLHHLATGYRWDLVNPNARITYLPHPKPVDGAVLTFGVL